MGIVFVGFIAGLSVGFTSMGVGSISTIGLILFSSFTPAQVVSANLINGTLMKTVGSVKHIMHNHIDIRAGLPFILSGIPGVICGTFFLKGINFNFFSLIMGILMLVFSIVILSEVFFLKTFNPKERLNDGVGKKIIVVALGIGIGFIVGLTSLGSGQLILISMITFQRLSIKNSIGTAVLCGALTLGLCSIFHFFVGDINWGLIIKLLSGSLPGVWIGSHYCSRANDKVVRLIIGLLIFSGGIAVIAKGL